jgi:hypothetical protein
MTSKKIPAERRKRQKNGGRKMKMGCSASRNGV